MEMDGFQSRINGSFDRTVSRSSTSTRRPLFSSDTSHLCDDEDLENESVSEAGDIGDRVLLSSRSTRSGRFPSNSIDNSIETGSVVPIPEDAFLQSFRFRSHDPSLSSNVSPVSPLTQDITAPLSTYNTVSSSDQKLESEKKLPWLVEYISCLVHLASFGILGVLTRYLLQKLFGPGEIGATSDHSYMYLDLPSNMVGSFLMGWFGVVFKQDIARCSEHILIGLTTGYLGSLTTFSGWNQKMIELSVEGRWVFAVLGCVVGLFLVAYSIIFGVETAEGMRWILIRRFDFERKSKMEAGYRSRLVLMVIFSAVLATLWSISGSLERNEFHNGGSRAQLWLACLVGPLGVWIRWFLARLNGRGIGKSGMLKWVPFGTLVANVSAACIMAGLATMKKAVNTKNCTTIASGFQFGLMGCLSTVSTFAAEFHAMRVSKHTWRAYAYATTTILMSFVLGTLIYSVPVWINRVNYDFWPKNPSSYRKVTEEYNEELVRLTEKLLDLLSEGLGLEKKVLKTHLGDEKIELEMKINMYPPCPQPELALGVEPHTDMSALTLLVPNDDVPGLQVWSDPNWVSVDYLPNAIYVHIGDQIEVLSNGKYKSVLHRSLVNKDRKRMSWAVFAVPPHEAVIGPVPELVDDDEHVAKYSTKTFAEYRSISKVQ